MNFKLENPQLQEKINDYLETLQNSNRSFLLGAGCSKCANLPLTSELTILIKEELEKQDAISPSRTKSILGSVMDNFELDSSITIEEYISELVDFAAILERRNEKGTEEKDNARIGLGVNGETFTESDFKIAVLEIQKLIVTIIGRVDFTLNHHNSFIKAIHDRLDNGRYQFLSPTNYFVLNYDTLVEDALCANKVHYADGFRGGAIGWWDPAVFRDREIRARLLKLHGSLDWCISNDDKTPRRLKQNPICSAYNLGDSVLIYPCATKYKETQNDPFAQLLGNYRDLLRNEDKAVLTICGYRFADNHINVEIEKALKDGRNLTAIIFTDLESPEHSRVLKSWYNDRDIRPHVKFFTRKGFFHNGTVILEQENKDIDWWKFETLTEILNK